MEKRLDVAGLRRTGIDLCISYGGLLPCPGISEPESLTPASRLIIDSIRSPKTDPKKLTTPKTIELRK